MRHQNHAPAAGKRCKRPAVSSCFVTVIGLWLVLPAVDCLAQAPPVLSAPQPELSTLIDLQASELTESSGIAELNGQLWTHNDSGDQPRLFAFDLSGQLLAQVTVSGATAIDWEDICAFTRDDRSYLAVGDVGDNNGQRPFVSIYVIELPDDWQKSLDKNQCLKLPITGTFQVTYPTGAVNSEALAYDPLTREFILATKELLQSRLFGVDASRLTERQVQVAQGRGLLNLPLVTAADISANGKHLVLTTYGPGCLLTRPRVTEPYVAWSSDAVMAALQVFELPLRKQGESVGFDGQGTHLWLTSEFAPTPLWLMPVP